MGEIAPQDPRLYEAVSAFVLEARENYREVVNERTYLPRDSTFPTLSTFEESGFPYVSPGINASVPEYDRLFSMEDTRWTVITFGEWDSWKRLVEVVEGHDRLVKFMGLPSGTVPTDGDRRRMWLISIQLVPLGIFDRLMHVVGIQFDDASLLEAYLPVERYLLNERLDVSFVVPVALTRFSLPDRGIQLTNTAAIVELTKGMQLARVPEYQVGATVNRHVLSAATHAFVLFDWWITNEHEFSLGGEELDWYPLDRIDCFFQALRIVTGIDTGYAQVFILPRDWARRWRADLPPIETGALGRRYPPHFEKRICLRETPAVSEDDAKEVARIYGALSDAPSNLALAARRLSSAMLREDEADVILDLCIGLEAALGDPRSKTEIVHKLGLRAAAVLALDPAATASPHQVFRDVRDIYDYRSAVAHGDASQDKKRHLRGEGNERTDARPASVVATDFLRRALRILLARPELRDPRVIDEQLILSALGAPSNADVEPIAPAELEAADE
jgi:hypothetical protein